MAHTKAKGSSKNNRDSQSKRLGVKLYGGEVVKKGMIIVRQRGAQFHAGENTQLGRDFSLYATAPGTVNFKKNKGVNFVEIVSK